jgi:hypothetical protein
MENWEDEEGRVIIYICTQFISLGKYNVYTQSQAVAEYYRTVRIFKINYFTHPSVSEVPEGLIAIIPIVSRELRQRLRATRETDWGNGSKWDHDGTKNDGSGGGSVT